MACRAESASHTDSPRQREPGSGPALQRGWVLGSPPIRVRPGSRNVDRRLLASADLHFESCRQSYVESASVSAKTILFATRRFFGYPDSRKSSNVRKARHTPGIEDLSGRSPFVCRKARKVRVVGDSG